MSLVRLSENVEPATPPTGKIFLWYDDVDTIFKYKDDSGTAIPLVGNGVLNGTIDPTTEGNDGDFYINTSTNTLFGPKASGTWPTGVSLEGPTGPTGSAGPGVPVGGTTGQVLAKIDATDYNTQWVDDEDTTDHTALSNIGTNTHAQIDSHIASTSNPHSVTATQVGLGNVDNTSDLNKPISTATQTALDLKYDDSNPDGFETPSQLNTRDTNNRARANHTGTQTASTISDFDAEVANNSAVTANTAKVTNATHTGDVTGATSLTLESVAITGQTSATVASGDSVLISDADDSGNLKKVTAQDIADLAAGTTDHTALSNIGTNTHAQIDTHIASTSNPHSVTKAQVGLSNVDNTADSAKTIAGNVTGTLAASTIANDAVTNARLANMATQTFKGRNTAGTGDPQDLTMTTARTMLSISNVDNTSDANKPISTATQTALDLKADEAIEIIDGYGITGGGDLSADRTLSVELDTTTVFNAGFATTSSTSFVLVTDMTITPAAGTYFVIWEGSCASGGAAQTIIQTLFVDGVEVPAATRAAVPSPTGSPYASPTVPFTATAVVTVDGTEAIEGRFRVTSGSHTYIMLQKAMTIVRIA